MTIRNGRLLPDDCLIAADVFKELSLNHNISKAKRRLNMQIINKKRNGKIKSAYFFKEILQTLKKNKLQKR